jgi:coenzyme F420-reducing hydrogenase beta subunit/polysaccharide pyruvyl transferase WcaK-like protein
VGESTVAYNHCIGCGVCEASCPHDAISMSYNPYKELIPTINNNCTQCTTCVEYCPHTQDKISSLMQLAIQASNPHTYGLGEGVYLAYDKEIDKRLKSASGGALSAFLKELLEKNIINYVVHAQMQEGFIGQAHYSASLSSTSKEIDAKRSSFYSPISFEKVLKTFENTSYKLIVVGVPCTTRAIKNLFENHKLYNKNTLYTAALSCSHNVNGQFIDYLAESENISKTEAFKINLRNKDDIIDANHFKNHFFSDSYNGTQTILKKDRFHTQFTTNWRNYYFVQNICYKCSDFWGKDADLSVKDAWGKWATDPLGKSLITFRNNTLQQLFENSQQIEKTILQEHETKTLQKQTTHFKHRDVQSRIEKKPWSLENVINGYFRKYLATKLSKFFYKKTNYFITNLIMNFFEKCANFFQIIFPKKLSKIFHYKKLYPMHRIYIVGGYGYSNVGDEAQLNTVLKNLEHYFPNYFKIVGTHNRMFTYKNHNHKTLFDSPREAFFNHNSDSMYKLETQYDFFKFFLSFILVYLNSFLVRAELPTFFINAKKAALLNEIKNCDLVFFSGGGYLTGDTLSRLYDGILLILIAKIFDNKVVMTGQTIGLWKNSFTKFLAKKAFSKVDLITTRDPHDSIYALKEINVIGKHISYICDDALFCDTTDNLDTVLQNSKYTDKTKEFISMNVHYWGMQTQEEKKFYLDQVTEILRYILEHTTYTIIFVPMAPSDERSIDDLLKQNHSHRFFKLRYNYDFKIARGIIKKSKLCITMKHHPIIFALGETIPVISLYYSEYYRHKNGGALRLFDLEDFNLNLQTTDFLELFINKFNIVNNSELSIKTTINNHLMSIKMLQDDIYKTIQIRQQIE